MSKTGRKRNHGLYRVNNQLVSMHENLQNANIFMQRSKRLPKESVLKIFSLREQGYSFDKISIILGVGRTTVYRYCSKKTLLTENNL